MTRGEGNLCPDRGKYRQKLDWQGGQAGGDAGRCWRRWRAAGHVLLEDFSGDGQDDAGQGRWHAQSMPSSSGCNSHRICCLRTFWVCQCSSQRDPAVFIFPRGADFSRIFSWRMKSIGRRRGQQIGAAGRRWGESQVSVEGERRDLEDLFFVIADAESGGVSRGLIRCRKAQIGPICDAVCPGLRAAE